LPVVPTADKECGGSTSGGTPEPTRKTRALTDRLRDLFSAGYALAAPRLFTHRGFRRGRTTAHYPQPTRTHNRLIDATRARFFASRLTAIFKRSNSVSSLGPSLVPIPFPSSVL
jgi:hypothetical protein